MASATGMLTRKKILEYSFKNNLGHIPSALSMIDYLESVFKYIKRDDKILLGKPFGACAYYTIWKDRGWLKDINGLHMGVKHDEIPFIDYSEETMGNALGVAAGMSMCTDKNVYVNISDAALQMGNTLEAIQFIGHHNLNNIVCTVDYNNAQVLGKISDILSVQPVITFAKLYNWDVFVVDGHNSQKLDSVFQNATKKRDNPSLVICVTKKGSGVKSMERDIRKWHYKKIESETELQSLVAELRVT